MDDMWAEIDAIYKLPERQEGDIDSSQMEKRYNISERTALRMMHQLDASGEYELLTVKDTNHPNGKRMVIRKIK